MKIIALSLAVMLATGCATADQRMANRADYRDSQIEAIKVQSEAETARQTNHAIAQQQMWKSMAEVVKSNPDSASHFAIVMAVAAARGAAEQPESSDPMSIKTERPDATALDYVKVLAPALINTVGTVGTAAILADQTKESIRANRDVRIIEAQQDGRMYDVLGAAVDGSSAADDTTDPADTTDPIDTIDPVDDVVDPDVVDPDDTTEPEEDVVDCTPPLFSPTPPECA